MKGKALTMLPVSDRGCRVNMTLGEGSSETLKRRGTTI
jgi:hypothetical protein